jgi:hypothetical protein
MCHTIVLSPCLFQLYYHTAFHLLLFLDAKRQILSLILLKVQYTIFILLLQHPLHQQCYN